MCLCGFGRAVQSGVVHQRVMNERFTPLVVEAPRNRLRAKEQGIIAFGSCQWSTWLHNVWCSNTLCKHDWATPFQTILVTQLGQERLQMRIANSR